MPAIVTTNPTTEEPLARYPFMTEHEVSTALETCHNAFLKWKMESPQSRADIISKIGEGLQKNKQKLAQLMTQEMGKLLSQSEDEVDLCSAICEWTAENGPSALSREERDIDEETRGIITYSPIGVVYGIQPWNYPAYQVARYSIANLMAGNGVLLKHAEIVTGTGKMLQEIYEEAGLPKGLFQAIMITHDQSDAVINDDRVRGVTLTGSPVAGRAVAEVAGKALKKTVLELGANDAFIVLEDADIADAIDVCVQGRIYNNGETCIAAKRFVVVESVYDKFKDGFVKAMSELKMGDPTLEDTDLGPMARKDLRDGLHDQLIESVAKGAKILCGGEIPDETGFFYPPTVIENVDDGQPAYGEELFGPVASLIKAKDADDAMRISNDSRFGLGGGILTKDTDKAIELAAEHFDTGMVFINKFGLATPNMPFGGVKDSGYGREHGGFGMKEFVNAKSIIIRK